MQTIFINLCRGLIHNDYGNTEWLSQMFDHSAKDMEDLAIKLGKSADPKHTVKAIRVVEELRAVVLGNKVKPKDAV
jgi:hypothetical protein